MSDSRPTRAVIDLAALAHNFAIARRFAGARDVIAVVKADGYGCGAADVARRLLREGCRTLAVATVSEVAQLRAARIDAPVLLLGGVHDAADARVALTLGATPLLHHDGMRVAVEDAAASLGRRAGVHVEVDTGMRRLGVPVPEAADLIARVSASPQLKLEGVSTHFARADEADPAAMRAQAASFARVLDALRARGVAPGLVHLANSAGLAGSAAWQDLLPGDAVRPGILLYGVAPAPHLSELGLRPVMTLRTAVTALRPVAAGEGVGYGAVFRAPRSGRIATLPMGYADGIPWSLGRAGAGGTVLVAGGRCAIAGRISMDLITVFVEDDAVALGDEAIVFGAGAPVEALAAAADTLPYELLVRVGSRVPRTTIG